MAETEQNGSVLEDQGASEGSQSEARDRPYVVLEQQGLADALGDALEAAGVHLEEQDLARIEQIADDRFIYFERSRLPARNAAHALTQVARQFEVGLTPPLVGVSERMFKPRQVKIELGDPRVSLS